MPQFLQIKPLSFLVNLLVSIKPHFPTQNFEKMSATTSSDTARPSSSAILPSAFSMSEEAMSCERPILNELIASHTKSRALVRADFCLADAIIASEPVMILSSVKSLSTTAESAVRASS